METAQSLVSESEIMPDITLYIGSNDNENMQGFEILDSRGLTCTVIPRPQKEHPVAVWYPIIARGLSAIWNLADAIHAFEETLIAKTEETMPDLIRRGNPELVKQSGVIRAKLREEALAIIQQKGD